MDGTVHRLSADAVDKNARLKLLTGAVVVALLALGMVACSAGAARADTASPSALSPSPLSPSTPPPVSADLTTPTPPAPPSTQAPDPEITIDSPSNGAFVGSGRATISGAKGQDDTIQLSVGSTGDAPACVVDAPGTTWTCSDIPLPDGPSVALTAMVVGDSTRSASTTIAVLGPPTIAENNGGVLSNGLVHGSAYPGARVTASVSGGTQCSFTADSSGRWACVLGGMPDGSYTISVSQTGPSGFPSGESDPSAAAPFLLDTVAPGAPTVTTPSNGTHLGSGVATTYSGAGEDGATVTVWAGSRSGSSKLCTATVSSGVWSCVGGPLPPGQYVVSALQEDAAGNTSSASVGLALRYATPPVPAPSGSPSEGAPAPNESTTPSAPASPSAPDTGSPAPSAPKEPGRTVPPTDDFAPSLTPLTAAVHPVAQLGTLFDWIRSGILALIALALLAIPARMLAGTVATARAGSNARGWSLFGRNQAKHEFEEAPDVHAPAQWVVPAAGLLAATALVTLSSPVENQLAYLRMSLAVLGALLVVGALAVAVPRVAARRFANVSTATAFVPYTLLLVAAASAISRLLELQPALLFGVVAMVTVTAGSAAARGKIAAITVGSLTALAAIGWLAIGVLPEPNTAVAAFTAEFVNAVVLVAIGSAAVLMLPLGTLPGRMILRWSWGIWLAGAVAVDTVLFAILVPIGRLNTSGTGTILFAVCTIGFAAISSSVWLWQRYIAPALR
jgi:hypothetical protein